MQIHQFKKFENFFLYCTITLVLLLANLQASFAIPLPLKDAIEMALEKSPDVLSLENQFESASAKKRIALSPSEPTLSIGYNDLLRPFTLGTSTSNTFQLTQTLGFPGRAWLNRSQLSDQAEAINYQTKSMKLQVSLNVKQAYFALQLAQENIRLNDDTRLAYERILAVAKRRFEAAQATQVDYLNAQVTLLQNQNDLTDLQAAEKGARTQLNILLHNPPLAPVEVMPIRMIYYPTILLDDAISKMLENRNEIKAAQASSNAADKAYKLAWMSALPDFQLTAGTTLYNVPAASPLSGTPQAAATGSWPTHTYMFGIQMTVPLWFFFNEREAIVGASHDRAAAEASLAVVTNQSKVALESAVDGLSAFRDKIENLEKHLLPMSKQSFDAAMVNYSTGKLDFPTLTSTAAAWRSLKQTYYQAVTTYLTNYAAYGQLIGEDL